MMLSSEDDSWSALEGHFGEPRACEWSVNDGSSSVSVRGGGEDAGKGDEARSGAVNATDADTTVLGRGVGSSSLSTAYLAGGTILCEGQLIMRLRHWVGKNGVLKGPFIRGR